MSWLSRFKNALRPQRLDQDVADELQDHLDRRAAALREQGLTPEEARRQATLLFGNVVRVRERSREVRMWSAIEATYQDVRYACRGIRKSPAFAVTSVLSLGLAIGTITAIYSIVDAALLRPLPVPESQRLVVLATPAIEQPGATASAERDDFSYPLYLRLRAAAAESAHLALFGLADRGEVQGSEANAPIEKAVQQYISGEAFGILNVPPALGRVFSPEDDRVPGAAPYVVLSNDYWRRRFGANPAILGHKLIIGNSTVSVVGVAAAGFFGIEPGRFVDFWIPVSQFDPGVFSNPNASLFRVLGRLSPGFSREQLQSRLQPVFHLHQEDMIRLNPDVSNAAKRQMAAMAVRVHRGDAGASAFRGKFGHSLWILLGVAAGILLIACANVASLLLARATARTSEMALRVSLGAGRLRLVRQLLTESLLLSVLACGAGWLLALFATPVLIRLLSGQGDPLRFAVVMDTRVLLFCAGVSALAAVSFGLLPAWQAAGTSPIKGLYGIRGQAGQLRLGRFFVGIQVAFAFCLVVAGSGFLFSLHNLLTVETGFDPHGVTVLNLVNTPAPNQNAFLANQQLQTRVAGLPGVRSAVVAWSAIFDGTKRRDQVILPGKPSAYGPEVFYRVSAGYFTTLRTPLLSGRDLSFRDTDAVEPVPTVVNVAFVRRYFGGGNALGQEFRRQDGVLHKVVGVAGNALMADLRGGPQPVAYFPMKFARRLTIYVRSSLNPVSVARLVEREGTAIGLRTRAVEITTLETLVGNSLVREKLLAGIGGVFALLGLVLAAIGLFGLLNYSVLRRTREIGLRAALGARRHELLWLVFTDLFGMMGGGLIAGVLGSLALMSVVRSQLFGVGPADPYVMVTAAGVFLAAALVAGGLPARRAVAIDPLIALRHE